MKGSKKEQIEADIAKLKEKAKQAEEQFFISLDLTEFPTMNDIIFDEESKKKAIEWIAKIVWYLLKRDGEIFTLTQYEQDLIEVLNGKENAKYNNITKKLQESFKKNKGKKIREYKKEYKNDGFYNEGDDDYNKNFKFSNSDFTPDSRVNDIIDELQKLLFCRGFLEAFYEQYGEISNNEKEFVDFCKKTIREHIFVDRPLNEEKYLQFLQEQNEDNQQDEQKISNEIIKRNMDIIKFLRENRTEVNNTILKELLQNNSINKTEEIKKSLIAFYIEYKDFIATDSSKSPSDMKVFTLLGKYFGEQETKQKKREIKNFPPKKKQEWIERQLDPLCFWKTFSDKYKEDINNINYMKEYRKIKSKNKNESRLKENIILKMRDIIVNYSISKDISIGKEETEIIISLLKRLLYLKGKILTKLEINELANKISKYNSCDKYKSYIEYSVFGLKEKQKEIEEHIKKCENCRAYKDYISSSKTLRENRNKKILKIVKSNPYVAEQLNEESYKDINYLQKQFRENSCETNFYYLVSAYIKNGDKKYAEKLLNEKFNLCNEEINNVKL